MPDLFRLSLYVNEKFVHRSVSAKGDIINKFLGLFFITFSYLFDGFQRRFSTPSMSKPTRTGPKRQRASDSYQAPPALQWITTGITQPPDNSVDLPEGHESHHDLCRTRVSFRVIFSLSRRSICFSVLADQVDRRLTPSRNLSHDGSRSALFEQLLVILVTARPYSTDTFEKSEK